MKVLGGLAILLAAFLALGAYYSYNDAKKLREANTGSATVMSNHLPQGNSTQLVRNTTSFLNDIDNMRIQELEDQGNRLAIAAVVIGVLGLIFYILGMES